MMGAAFLGIPELKLEEQESKDLAMAVKQVTDLYDMPLMDEKTLAWINLTMTASAIYGTRAVVIVRNNKQRKTKVVQMGVVNHVQ